jgi:hypothetical protein
MSGASPSSKYEDGVYVALRYENDGQNLTFAGPFQTYDDDEEEWKTFCVASASVTHTNARLYDYLPWIE